MSVNKKRINDRMTERGGFAMIPNEIWEIRDLDHTAKVIWCYIFSRAHTWQSSNANIARNLKLSTNTVALYVPKLVELNMIIVEKGANNANNFEIVPPELWCIKTDGPQNQIDQTIPDCGTDPKKSLGTQEGKKGKQGMPASKSVKRIQEDYKYNCDISLEEMNHE